MIDMPMGGCSTSTAHYAHLNANDPTCENQRTRAPETTMTLPKIVRNIDAAAMMIRERKPFQTRPRRTPYGDFVSMSGLTRGNRFVSLGRDPDSDDRTPEIRHLRSGGLPEAYHDSLAMATFIVYSYDTPIAWHTDRPHELDRDTVETWLSGGGQGVWIMPEVKYTVTTTQHQTEVRHALGGLVYGWWSLNEGERLAKIPYVEVTAPGAPAKVEGFSVERNAY